MKETTTNNNQSPKKKKSTAKTYIIRLLTKLCATALAVFLILNFVAGLYVSHTNSSYPMIKDGDLCLTYRLERPEQGEVVAYKHEGETKFGRVIAFEGDTVDIKDDLITVNGYGIYEETVYPTTAEGSSISYPYTVPDDSVFVLNDFRSDVSDSRALGAIPLGSCNGKVVFIMRRRGI